MAEAVGVTASIIAIVELSAKLTKLCVQYSKDVKNARDDIAIISRRVTDLEEACGGVQALLSGPDGHKLAASTKLVGAIDDALGRLQKLDDELAPSKGRQAIKKLGFRSFVWPFQKKQVRETVQDLEGCRHAMLLALQTDQTTILLQVDKNVTNVDQKLVELDQKKILSKLPVAHGASFDSREEEHHRTCHPETRQQILAKIREWSLKPDSEPVFWLNGMAGTGKSTIARTVAESFATDGRLGGSFFFKRGEGDRGGVFKFFTTIASQLVAAHPTLASQVEAVLDADPGIVGKGIQKQYEKLVLEPLSNIPRDSTTVIVVDALDECENTDDIRLIINLFSRPNALQAVKLRLFTTSRPELPILLGFGANKGAHQDLVLHEIPTTVIKHDIMAYLQFELARIKTEYNDSMQHQQHRKLSEPWPEQSEIDTLVDMATPLFIFAATVCRTLGDRRIGNPNKQLGRILAFQTRSHESKLDGTYLPALESMLIGMDSREKEEALGDFRDIVGSIIILASPLPATALAHMLDKLQDTVDDRLDLLHSVLSVPNVVDAPVRLLHLSFRDFLLDPDKRGKNEFWVAEKEAHARLSSHCLRVMTEGLRRDICGLKQPGALASSLEPELVTKHIPPALQYACQYWVFHLQGAHAQVQDLGAAHEFLKLHLLHWIEAMSLIGRHLESIEAVTTLQMLLLNESAADVTALLEDTICFLLFNKIIESHPLQLYSSALLFSPKNSIVRKQFEDQIPGWITHRPDVDTEWDACLHILEGHGAAIWSFCFSHDSKLLASAAADRTVRIWRIDTGVCLLILEVFTHDIIGVAFSSDSKFLLTGSGDKTVTIWRTDTGETTCTLKEDEPVNNVTISDNSKFVASGTNRSVNIWRLDTAECLWTAERLWTADVGHDKVSDDADDTDSPDSPDSPDTSDTSDTSEFYDASFFSALIFSPNSNMIAAGYSDYIQVWRVNSGDRIAKVHLPQLSHAAFSPDSALLACKSKLGVHIWSAETGQIVQQLENGRGRKPYWMDVLPSALCLAPRLQHGAVNAWSVDTWEWMDAYRSCPSFVQRRVLLSPDMQLAVKQSSTWPPTLEIWRTRPSPAMDAADDNDITRIVGAVAVSPDSSFVATSTSNIEQYLVCVWSTHTRRRVCHFEINVPILDRVVFSPDSTLIASTSPLAIHSTLTGDCLFVLDEHVSDLDAIAFWPDGTRLITGGQYETARIWDVETGKCLQTLSEKGRNVSYIAFSSHLPLFAMVSMETNVDIWHHSGQHVKSLNHDGPRIISLAFSPDSALLAASSDIRFCIWNCETGELRKKMDITGPENVIYTTVATFATALSNNHQYIAKANGINSTFQIRQIDTNALVHIIPTHQRLHSVSFEVGDEYIRTDCGDIYVGLGSPAPSSSKSPTVHHGLWSRRGIGVDADWLLCNDARVLWLPPKYRPSYGRLVDGQTVVLVQKSGNVLFVRLDERELSARSILAVSTAAA